jgi:DNA helicase IV
VQVTIALDMTPTPLPQWHEGNNPMKLLSWRPPTAEQLKIIGATALGAEVVRGAAGSGKTTTALLRLRNLSDMFESRHKRLNIERPVQILVLTFNRTLCGYVRALAESRAKAGARVVVEVDTFANWALDKLGNPRVLGARAPIVKRLGVERGLKLPGDFLCDEVEYVLGRFREDEIESYLSVERTGRGLVPRVEKAARQGILDVIEALKNEISERGHVDWEDLPVRMLDLQSLLYDVIIIDEAQDFSANQIRAVQHHLAKEHALTLVIDTVQRLYPRGYTWTEAGLDPRKVRFYRLKQNHRNTIEIAAFAKGILSGIVLDDDGTIPDLDSATRHGEMPHVVKGLYSQQLEFAINYIETKVNLQEETVAFLKPRVWFRELRRTLTAKGLAYNEITREKDWPDDDVNIVLCTMHSAKGLEFDHVIILGLNAEVTPHGGENDDKLDTLRRLLAMAVARARMSVIVGYKEKEASDLVQYFDKETFVEIAL